MITKPLHFHQENGLGILQIGTSDQDTFRCVPIEQAIREKMAEVREVTEAGSVNNLFVLNHSGEYIFLFDGDILAGAKQNRVVNTSILLAPESKTSIPVSCVEQGRWSYRSKAFSPTDYGAPISMRSSKAKDVSENLKLHRDFSSNQGNVWRQVSEFEKEHGVTSGTSNLSDLFEDKAETIESKIASFKAEEGANGVGVFLGGRLALIDIFNGRDLYHHYFQRILRGAAFEGMKHGATSLTESEAGFRVVDMLDKLEEAHFDEYDAVGTGSERRYAFESTHATRLSFQDKMIHTGVFVETSGHKGQ